MRWTIPLSTLFLSLTSFFPSTLADDAARAKFADLAAKNGGVVKLTSKLHEEITAKDRDWSVIVEYTALRKEMNCNPCHTFEPNWKEVARAWTKVKKDTRSRHFFATLDFTTETSQIYRDLGYSSAPNIVYYPAEDGPHKGGKQVIYDFNQRGFQSADLAEFLSTLTPVKVPYSKPLNWNLILSTGITVSGVLVGATLFWSYFRWFLLSRWTWALAATAGNLIFTAGYMFTRIRHMPFAQPGRKGPEWIASGYSNQFGAEIYLVSTIYGSLALTQIALIFLVPRTLKPSQQRVAIYIWSGVTILLHSVLLSVFRLKHGGYPFKLLLS